jgi:DNA-binding beta-propeller fold protein YncE
MAVTTSWRTKAVLLLAMIGAVTALGSGSGEVGGPRLIAVEPLPDAQGAMCAWLPAGSALGPAAFAQEARGSTALTPARPAVRVIADPHASFSAVAVDPVRNEVVFADESTFGVMVYDRLTNTPPAAAFSEPKRVIRGSNTKIEYMCAVHIDPATGDIYLVNNDTHDNVVIYSRDVKGNAPPTRELTIAHSGFGFTVDERAQEMYVTHQQDNAITVYKKTAEGEDSPIRLLQGDRTRLADPRGVVVDSANQRFFVVNHGHFHSNVPGGVPAQVLGGAGEGGTSEGKVNWPVADPVPGTGKNGPSSITVYAIGAEGDTPPLYTIEGPNTQLNWPSGLALEPQRNELFVANDTGDSILVFSATAKGNATPLRVLKGPKTGLRNPTGVALDLQNDELWVANFGDHTATVYKTTAAGDTPPLRTIRSSPVDTPRPFIGNPGGVAYDSKRDELLVAN